MADEKDEETTDEPTGDEETSQDPARKLRFSQRLNIVLGVVSAFLLVVVIAQFGASSAANGSSTASPSASSTRSPTIADQVARNRKDDPMALGSLSAPVTMVAWVDLRCPYCAMYEKQTMPQIIKQYVDAGTVRYEVHDVAIFGEQSLAAAVAARAAGQQGRYFEYLTVVYGSAPLEGHPNLTRDKLIAFATAAGVPDVDKFTKALSDKTLAAEVQSSTASAKQIGVTAVPFFVIGNKSLSGAQPIGTFQQTIDAEVTAAG